MANEFRMLRVLQHDTEDQIRISSAFGSYNVEKSAEQVIEQYARDLEWCGGFAVGCAKYYRRLALVDAESLEVVRMIYLKLKN